VSSRDGVPVLDVGALRSGSESQFAALARQIGLAARTTGFFSIVNHGVPDAQIAAIFAEAKRFFALPLAEKRSVSVAGSDSYRGYAEIGYEQLDEAHPGDAKESFDVGPELAPQDPDFYKPFHGGNPWPNLPGFRQALLGYYDTMFQLCIDLHRPLAIDLGAEPDYFTRRIDRGIMALRLLRYPPHPGTFDGTLHGAAPHTDYGTITLLAQDGTGGLDLRTRDGQWLAVEPTPRAFVCNIGDCLMRWSNDVYVSTPHRVVNRAQQERYSIAFFGSPNGDALVEALASCTSAEHPAKYPPISYEEYLRYRISAAYPLKTS
jgi:isopenicillin N synthase-like dioxygenase